MNCITYQLTNDDLQLLYPLYRVEDIVELFPDNTPTTSTIRRRYKRLGLAPINSALREFEKALQGMRPADVPESSWLEQCTETLNQLRQEKLAIVRQKIQTVQSRVST